MPRLLNALIAAAFLAAAGCYTQPPPPATEQTAAPSMEAQDRRLPDYRGSFGDREVVLNYRKAYIRSIPGLGVVADIAVITDLIGHSIQNTDDITRLIAANGGVAYFFDQSPGYNGPPILVMPQKTAVSEALAADGIRGLYIHCAEERLKRDQFLLDYLRGTDNRLGDHRDLVNNHEASLRMYEKAAAIEQAWLGALKSGVPLSAAKRNKVQSCAAFVKELVAVRGEQPPPPLLDAKESSKRAARAFKRAKRIAQKLAMPADTSEWTPERTARHEAMRAAVQTWLIAAEKRLKAEDAYARALKSGGEPLPSQASVWKARYAAYEAFANACVEALNPAWLPPPPAFIALSKIKREADWRLDPATAALEAARASVAVWRRFDMRPYSNFLSHEPYKSTEGFRKAFDALPSNIVLFKPEPVLKWRDAVQKWQAVLADENADDAEKIAAANAALAAQDEYRAVPKPDYWSFVDEKYRIPIFMEGEESSVIDVETAVYEIAVHKIAESMPIAMDIEHIYEESIRLGREERAEGALEQLVAVKEWQAALTDGGATEEEVRLAQDIAMSYGSLFTWKPYRETVQKKGHPREVHPLKFRNDSTSAW